MGAHLSLPGSVPSGHRVTATPGGYGTLASIPGAGRRQMLGPPKLRALDEPVTVSLEELIPTHHFYRHLDAALDLAFVREWVQDRYAERGRPSIDPVVFFKLQLIMFFEGIRSERRLSETASLHLAHRWYLGYALDEPLPDHSSLTRIRLRLGLGIFERFFEHIVELCQQAGLVWGKELIFDATKVRANAALDSLVPRFYLDAKEQTQEHLGALFADEPAPTRPAGRGYQRTGDWWASPTDRDATPMRARKGERASLGYHDHYVVDGGRARIILAALVTPADVMENQPMLDLLWRVRFRWHPHPERAIGDTTYGTVDNIRALEDAGIRAYVPLADWDRTPYYGPSRFR